MRLKNNITSEEVKSAVSRYLAKGGVIVTLPEEAIPINCLVRDSAAKDTLEIKEFIQQFNHQNFDG